MVKKDVESQAYRDSIKTLNEFAEANELPDVSVRRTPHAARLCCVVHLQPCSCRLARLCSKRLHGHQRCA